jgi:hypothetical protein
MLVHVNGSMFLPQVAETDIYNTNGQQQDDINTLIEYAERIISDTPTSNPVDEDNDQGQNFHLVKIVDYCYAIEFSSIRHKPVVAAEKNKYCIFPEQEIYPVTLEILAPPPKA